MELWMIWLIIIILLAILEVMTVNLVSIWFIASAFVSLLLSFVVDSFPFSFAVFVCLGLILMLITRPFLLKKWGPKNVKTNYDRVIGMEGIVTEEINKNKVGEVKVDGKRWSAISNKKIKIATSVIIEDIEGVKLVVREEDE